MPDSSAELEPELDNEWAFVDSHNSSSEALTVNDIASFYSEDTWSVLADAYHDQMEGPLVGENVHGDELRDIKRAIRASLADMPPPSFQDVQREIGAKRKRTQAEVPPQYTRAKIATRDARFFPPRRPSGPAQTVRPSSSHRESKVVIAPGSSKSHDEEASSSKPEDESSKISPLLQKLPADLLPLLTQHLYFPDLFALSLSCRTLHDVADLPAAKHEYIKELREIQEIQIDEPGRSYISAFNIMRKGYCEVCLYKLDKNYFAPKVSAQEEDEDEDASDAASAVSDDCLICADCKDVRARIAREKTKTKEELRNFKGHGNTLPVWRCSEKVWLRGRKGDFWYRDRP